LPAVPHDGPSTLAGTYVHKGGMSPADLAAVPHAAHLAALVALTEHRTVTAAAEALGLTQSAVSKQLAALERSVGACLVDRTGREMRVTASGRAIARASGAYLSALGTLIESVARNEPVLSVHIPLRLQPIFVPSLARFAKARPGPTKWVPRAQADLVVTTDPDDVPHAEKILLCAEEWVAVTGPGGPQDVALKDLGQHVLLSSGSTDVARWTRFLSSVRQAKVTQVSAAAKADHLATGRGIAIVSLADVAPQIRAGTRRIVCDHRIWPGGGLYAMVRDRSAAWDRAWHLAQAFRASVNVV
ncbi:MAG: LysR family transcriptional regulator, partial [Pseudomonadota bacterium]